MPCYTSIIPLSHFILQIRVKFLSIAVLHLLHSPVTVHTTNAHTLTVTCHVTRPSFPFHIHTTNTDKIPVTCHVTPPASSCHLSSVQHKQFLSLGILPLLYPRVSCHTTNTCQSPVMYASCISVSPAKLTTNVKFLSCHPYRVAVYPPFFTGHVYRQPSSLHLSSNVKLISTVKN